MVAEHFLSEINQPVARGLSARQGTAVSEALAREHALIKAGYALILAVKETYFTASHAYISCGDVHVRAYMLI